MTIAHNLIKRIFSTSRSTSNTTNKTMPSHLEQETLNLRLHDPDLTEEETNNSSARVTAPVESHKGVATCPYSSPTTTPAESRNGVATCPYRFVPLRMGGSGGTHKVSDGSASLMHEVSLEDLQGMTERFYQKAFKDPTIDRFLRSHDDPHGARFSKWIHQKLSGSNVWDEDRAQRDTTPVMLAGGRTHIVHDRSSAHVAAWYSPKRPANEVGRHFELEDCRVWMRLHFWAMRESGIMEKSPTFADYYVRFIGHFVRVYESTAPMFARDSFRWSADPKNIEKYKRDGMMHDVLGLSLGQAEAQIPESEANDFKWPYNKAPQ